MSLPISSSANAWRRGRALRFGARVAVVAASGPVPPERYAQGLERLSARYQVESSLGLFSQTGFLAGSDGRRLAELRWALGDASLGAVIAARGGHGLLRLVSSLQTVRTEELRAVPVVGFSDVTVLHAWAHQRRLVTIHGPVVTQFGELSDADQSSLWTLLEDSSPPPPLTDLSSVTVMTPPTTGRLLGGNLEVLSRLCGTSLASALRPGGPVVLLLEEVTEAPYRIDRALAQLQLAGMLADVCAVLVGDLVRCEGPPSHPSALSVIAQHFGALGVPVLATAAIGHGARNRAVPLGVLVRVEPQQGRIVFLEGAVG